LATIKLQTIIEAPIQRCFDLSTSIDLHKVSASATREEAIDGVTKGLIGLDDTVTWRAKHFGIWHKMKVGITQFEEPHRFTDEMLEGSFKYMRHEHVFIQDGNRTIMIDHFHFASPFGFFGQIVDKLILRDYMEVFLLERNLVIKKYAETDKWESILG